MKSFFKKKNQLIAVLYGIGAAGMLLILVLIMADRQNPALEDKPQTYTDISASWTLDREGTRPVDFASLGTYMDPEKGVLSIYCKLPVMNTDATLVFRSKDVRTRVLTGEELLYETTVYESRYYNQSPGNLWNVVPIHSRYSSKYLEMQIEMVYDTSAVVVDSLYFGDKGDILFNLVKENMFGIITSMLLIGFGIIMILFDLMPTYQHTHAKRRHDLLWVGLFAALTGVWCLTETNMLQFFVRDMRILQVIGNMIMIVDSLPLWLYMDCEYGIFKYRGMRIFAYADVVYIVFCAVMQLSGVMDLHYMLNGAVIIMMVFDTLLFAWIVCYLIKAKRERKPILNCALQLFGFVALMGFGIFETVRSLQVDRIDRAGFVRVGMLILSVCFAASSQLQTYKLLEQGTRYDLVSRLAYCDGLTGLGNRTAYLEQLEHCKNASDPVGIVYLDVNNLKKVNDGQGHEFGDQLITVAARIIEDSFGKFGKAYCVGGDEFCVLMSGGDLHAHYEEGLATFRQLVDEANQAKWYTFDVQIAQGFAVCRECKKLDEAVAEADGEMYKNKIFLKRGVTNQSESGII